MNAELTPILSVVNNLPVVSSLKIAEHFGKQHKDVLKAIDKIQSDCPEDFNERNFALVVYLDAKGEKRPAYDLTRDGFTVLAMGFTGKRAMEWKIKYIKAFNAMEEELKKTHKPQRERPKALPPAVSIDLSESSLTLRRIKKLINVEQAAQNLQKAIEEAHDCGLDVKAWANSTDSYAYIKVSFVYDMCPPIPKCVMTPFKA